MTFGHDCADGSVVIVCGEIHSLLQDSCRTITSMDPVTTQTRCHHHANNPMLVTVASSTPAPRHRRNGLTPRTSSSAAQTMSATT